MSGRICRYVAGVLVPAFVLLTVAGCGGSRSTLPPAVVVELPDGTSVKVDQGAGAPSLKNSSWLFYRMTDNAQAAAFVTVVFDENGSLARFEDSTISTEVFGSTILFDGLRHNAVQSGLQYQAATYGAETADATAFAFEGRVTVYAAGLEAANATASAAAEFDANDPTIVRGTFVFSSRITLLSIPEGNQDDTFSFVGYRIIEE